MEMRTMDAKGASGHQDDEGLLAALDGEVRGLNERYDRLQGEIGECERRDDAASFYRVPRLRMELQRLVGEELPQLRERRQVVASRIARRRGVVDLRAEQARRTRAEVERLRARADALSEPLKDGADYCPSCGGEVTAAGCLCRESPTVYAPGAAGAARLSGR